MSCKRASLSIGDLLGNLEEVHLPGLLREKKSISGFLSWTWGGIKILSLGAIWDFGKGVDIRLWGTKGRLYGLGASGL